jgi:hypothetical protein
MIRGATDDVPLPDRLVARWELSRLASIPFSLSIMTVWPLVVSVWAFQALTGIRSAVPALVVLGSWCVLAGLDVARSIWVLYHPYASPRWLRAVHAAVGEEVAVGALAHLIRCHDHEPDYVVKRSDMMIAVQLQRNGRLKAARRAQGVRLVEAPASPDPEALADAERRRLARERRAARPVRPVA